MEKMLEFSSTVLPAPSPYYHRNDKPMKSIKNQKSKPNSTEDVIQMPVHVGSCDWFYVSLDTKTGQRHSTKQLLDTVLKKLDLIQ